MQFHASHAMKECKMKYSTSKRLDITDLTTRTSRQKYFEAVGKQLSSKSGALLLLAGGVAPIDLAVRNAQSILRLDQSPSHWSHAALILDWNKRNWKGSKGIEVRLDAPDVMKQVPERNGATSFRLGDYDQPRWVNLAIVQIEVDATDTSGSKRSGKSGAKFRKLVGSAAMQPCLERSRYRLWDWLAPWSAYSRAPVMEANPVSQGIPHPGAAFCEYSLEAAGVDLTPNSTEPSACPETIWSAMLYWHDVFKSHVGTVTAWVWLSQRDRCGRETLAPKFPRNIVE
ncbi:MAG: hypothetical protein KF696_01370 [Planctomycetes bacterium]|nr:hypothetical protein [Planctomycetota bacterium]MCW8134410.1 hypothetical protein [Planctomycetota bacterium]